MTAFTVRRVTSMLIVLVALSVLVFLIFFATPGINPARQMAGRNATPQTLAQIRHDFGLDRPLPVQYALMMDHLLLKRDLTSYTNRGVRVLPEIAAATPVTLSLVFGAAIIWVLASLLIGTVAVVLRDTIWDRALMALALVGISVPVFWLGEVANLFTQDRWHNSIFSWVPPLGYTPLTQDPVMWFRHLIIPWLTLAALYVGLYARVLRAAMIDASTQDFVRTARSKGISERRVLVRHILRTSLLGFTALFGLDFGVLVGGGALVAEVVFNLPGVGRLTYESLTGLDLPVIMATVLYAGFFIVVVNAIVDIVYAMLDPRIRVA
jgi:peptide/nickel transport system permease protein